MTLTDPDPIENCSPSEIRHLLHKVLGESKALHLAYSAHGQADALGGEA
jgi:hypothetical protein